MWGLKSAVKILKRSAFMLVFFVVGCIQIEDIGDYWGKATLDPRLEGRWIIDSESYVTFTKGKDGYVLTTGDLEDGRDIPDEVIGFAKSLEREGVALLLVRDNLSKGKDAQMYPYKIVNGQLEVFHMESNCWGANECTRGVLEMAAEIEAGGKVNAEAQAPLYLEIVKLNDESLDALIYLFNHYPYRSSTIAQKTSK